MEKILLAINDKKFEEYLEKKLADSHIVVGALVHKDGILSSIKSKEPDILVLRETIQGNEDILKIMYTISTEYPNIRIVFISKDREAGDQLLATLVSYGIYDIIPKGKVSGTQVVNAICYPNTRTQVAKYLPISSYNEEKNSIAFESPNSKKEGLNVIGIGVGQIDNAQTNTGSIAYPGNKQEIPNIVDDVEEVIDDKKEEVPKKSKFIDGFTKLAGAIPEFPKKESVREVNNPSSQPVINNINITGETGRKIITFIGGKSGVGTTSMAINTAIRLANEGKKVIYLELNDQTPTTSYIYDLGRVETGIDTALTEINKGNFLGMEKAIIYMSELKKGEDKSNYKLFPDSLDFMFYSNEYLVGLKKDTNLNNPKDLYLNLLFQGGYDYVVIDTDSNIDNPMTFEALIYSNLIFTVITQDISSMGYQVFRLNKLKEKGLKIEDKNIYILNKYIDHSFDANAIVDWLELDSLTVVPLRVNEFISSSYNGQPLLSVTGDQTIKNSFSNILMKILSN